MSNYSFFSSIYINLVGYTLYDQHDDDGIYENGMMHDVHMKFTWRKKKFIFIFLLLAVITRSLYP